MNLLDLSASFTWPPISHMIKPCDIKKFQQKSIQFHSTFHSLTITNPKQINKEMFLLLRLNNVIFLTHYFVDTLRLIDV